VPNEEYEAEFVEALAVPVETTQLFSASQLDYNGNK